MKDTQDDDADPVILTDGEEEKKTEQPKNVDCLDTRDRQMNRDVIICRDFKEVQEMFRKRNLTNGMNYQEEKDEGDEEAAMKPDERIFKLPD